MKSPLTISKLLIFMLPMVALFACCSSLVNDKKTDHYLIHTNSPNSLTNTTTASHKVKKGVNRINHPIYTRIVPFKNNK